MKRVLRFVVVACCVMVVPARLLHAKAGSSEGHREGCEGTRGRLGCLKTLAHRLTGGTTGGSQLRGDIRTSHSPIEDVEDQNIPELQRRVLESEDFAATRDSESEDGEAASTGHATDARSKKKKASKTIIPLLMFLKLKALSVVTLLMVAFIKKMFLAGALLALIKTVYLKTDHTVGYEHVYHAHPHQEQHWQDSGKQFDHGLQDSYRFYAQQVTSHAGLQPQGERIQRDAHAHDVKSRKRASPTMPRSTM